MTPTGPAAAEMGRRKGSRAVSITGRRRVQLIEFVHGRVTNSRFPASIADPERRRSRKSGRPVVIVVRLVAVEDMKMSEEMFDSSSCAPALLSEAKNRLLRYVQRRVPQPADADDIVQEVLMRLLEKGELQRPTPALIFAIASNVIADHYRRVARRAMSELDVDVDVTSETSLADDARREIASCLEPFIERLPEPHRSTLRSVDIEGRTHRVIAEREGLSVSAIKSRVQRAREMILAMFRACCEIEVDGAGRLIDYRRRRDDGTPDPCRCEC